MGKTLEDMSLSLTSAFPTAAIGTVVSLASSARSIELASLDWRAAVFAPAVALFVFIINLLASVALSPVVYLASLTRMFDRRIPPNICKRLVALIGVAWLLIALGTTGANALSPSPVVFVAFAVPISIVFRSMALHA